MKNYIWALLIKAIEEGIPKKAITFTYPKRFSPYLELNLEHLNDQNVTTVAEVNPYYRFLSVFKDYFHPDHEENMEIREVLYDLIMHYLAELDTYMGITKREYQINFVIRDIEAGIFGRDLQNKFSVFSLYEKKIIGNNLLRLYMTGEGVYLFQDSVKKIFAKAVIYADIKESDTIMVHLVAKETAARKQKIQLLQTLFLPFKYEIELYWEYIFGVIDVEGFMKQEEIVMY